MYVRRLRSVWHSPNGLIGIVIMVDPTQYVVSTFSQAQGYTKANHDSMARAIAPLSYLTTESKAT